MPIHLIILLAVAACCSGLGFLGVTWLRCGRKPAQISWGRRLAAGMLVVLGGIALEAAWDLHLRELLYLGLIITSLLLATLWEAPQTRRLIEGG